MTTRTKRTTPTPDPLLAQKLEHHSHCQYPACTAPATTVDYTVPLTDGGNHDWHNLTSYCTTHAGRR